MNFTEYLISLDEALSDNARKILTKVPTPDQMGGKEGETDHHNFINDRGRRFRGRVAARYDDSQKKGYLPQMPKLQRKFDLSQRLTDRDLGSIQIYTGDEHEPINRLLRSGRPDKYRDYGEDDSYYNTSADLAKGLYQAVKKLPKEEGTFFRGLNSENTYKRLQNLNVGDEIDDQGFGSYTSKYSNATDFHTGNGWDSLIEVRGNRFRDISPLSGIEEENERLLLPGARMKLIEKTIRSYFNGPEIPTYIFDLLDEEEEDINPQEA